jgi:hypothetical protein
MFEGYVGPADSPIDFIGKQESLTVDMIRLLHARNERYDEHVFRNYPPQNTGGFKTEISEEYRQMVFDAEPVMYERFNYTR